MAVEEIYPELKAQGVKVYVVGVKGRPLPEGLLSFDDAVNEATDERLSSNWRDGIKHSSTMCYIYTSGTTGNNTLITLNNMSSEISIQVSSVIQKLGTWQGLIITWFH